MKLDGFADLRFWLTAWAAALVLMVFGLYFWGLRTFGHTVLRYPWGLFVGLPMALCNLLYNLTFATFVFWRLPVWTNTKGQFSPFFTTRIKEYRRRGSSRLIEYIASCINDFQPGHFDMTGRPRF